MESFPKDSYWILSMKRFLQSAANNLSLEMYYYARRIWWVAIWKTETGIYAT